jgi:histidyl-tRNA synthetase
LVSGLKLNFFRPLFSLFELLGIASSDVGVRLSSSQVLQAVLNMYSISEHLLDQVCVIVDKLGRLSRNEIQRELFSTGAVI